MQYSDWPSALLFVSILTSLSVEGLKTFSFVQKKYYNIIALVVSTIISVMVWWHNLAQTGGEWFTEIGVIDFIFFIFVNYIVTTVGYDKVLNSFKDMMNGGSLHE